ncbi:hypothetical protein GGS21DRAFT_492387 [Xylaria nigripes]|nr:hypothetical protein GGS21DRAFT_492387 [Xylaria nigripes]
MPKWDKTRNYYADLELQSSASSDEIKKQFKKLALKYHPDRNPGREAEVNPKFQVIQSAHEILSDATQKRQYDEARQTYTARYPSSSGIRGNPWQNAAKAYPPPPRRQPNTQTRPMSASQRYESFAANMPRTTRSRAPGEDSQFRRNNADAWDNLRPNSTRKNSQPHPPPPPPSGRSVPGRAPTSATRNTRQGPPPPPPRTAYQKQKAEAAFGTSKKTGFTPRAQGVADEPPVTNKNYFTNRTHSSLFTEPNTVSGTSPHGSSSTAADQDEPARPRDEFTDNRQRTPYHTPGGEKTSLFDNNPGLKGPTSTRTPDRPRMPGGYPRATPRSSSPATSSSNDSDSEESINVGASVNEPTSHDTSSSSAQPKVNESSKPQTKTQPTATFPPQSTNSTHESSIPSKTAAGRDTHSPSVYAQQNPPTQFQAQFTAAASRYNIPGERAVPMTGWSSRITSYHLQGSSSEEKSTRNFNSLLPLEMHQRMTLDHLVNNNHAAMTAKSGGRVGNMARDKPQHASPDFATSKQNLDANENHSSSFNFTSGSKPGNNGGEFKPFTRNSTENINTRFVDDASLEDWQFKAGSASANEAIMPSRPRPQSRNRPTRRQVPAPLPKHNFSIPIPEPHEASGETTSANNSRFEWNERIGPEHFEPQPTSSASTSPTRRAHSRRAKSFKMTAGTAAVVDDEESEGCQDAPQPSSPAPAAADPMDIDSPAPTKTEESPKPSSINRARKYSAEPHREDWRAGDVNGVAPKSTGPTTNDNNTRINVPETNGHQPIVDKFPSRHAGSEDSEDFVVNFSEFKKVEPFADPLPTGLKSFEDLKSTLPFESRASEQIPPDMKTTTWLLNVFKPPVAPRLPPMGVAGLRPQMSTYRKYVQDFYNYMSKWETYNNKVVTHLETRRKEFKLRCMQRGANWLEACAPTYLTEIDEDLEVQKKYAEACGEHRKRVAEYLEFKDRVLSTTISPPGSR